MKRKIGNDYEIILTIFTALLIVILAAIDLLLGK